MADTTMLQPFLAKSRASWRPMPREAPVITTVFPARMDTILTLLLFFSFLLLLLRFTNPQHTNTSDETENESVSCCPTCPNKPERKKEKSQKETKTSNRPAISSRTACLHPPTTTVHFFHFKQRSALDTCSPDTEPHTKARQTKRAQEGEMQTEEEDG